MGAEFSLSANNSSGNQRLIFTRNNEEKHLDFTLVGNYGGKPIQIDFDSLPIEDIEDLIYLLERNLDKLKGV